MFTRAAISVVAGTLMLSACGRAAQVAEPSPDLLFVRSEGNLALIHSTTGQQKELGIDAVPSRTWSALIRTKMKRKTHVEAVNPLDQGVLWTSVVPGQARVKLVSEDGRRAVLSPIQERHFTTGRARTRFLIVGDGIDTRTIVLEGNLEPEAFSTDGGSIFVLDYTPATRPSSYQVLKLDLTTGELGEVYTPDAELQERMEGTARTQAISPDGRYLYTLYTLGGDGGHAHAFVHVLNLEEEWAHCIDLPEGMGRSAEDEMALTVSPNGELLYVIDAGAGLVATVDTRSLSTTAAQPYILPVPGKLHALAGPRLELLLAKGRRVLVLEPGSLDVRHAWDLDSGILGIQLSSDGTKLYVGLLHHVEVLDIVTGGVLNRIDPAGTGSIDTFGPVLPPPTEEPPEEFTCAC